MRIELQTHRISSEHRERRRNRKTYLLDLQVGGQTSRLPWQTTRMRQTRKWMRTAVDMREKRLKAITETSERLKQKRRRRTHLIHSKTSDPSLQIDGNGAALETVTYMYVPSNALVEGLGTTSRKITFGEVESADSEVLGAKESIAANVESETVSDGDGD